MSQLERYLAREARREWLRRDAIPTALELLAILAAFLLGRVTA